MARPLARAADELQWSPHLTAGEIRRTRPPSVRSPTLQWSPHLTAGEIRRGAADGLIELASMEPPPDGGGNRPAKVYVLDHRF